MTMLFKVFLAIRLIYGISAYEQATEISMTSPKIFLDEMMTQNSSSITDSFKTTTINSRIEEASHNNKPILTQEFSFEAQLHDFEKKFTELNNIFRRIKLTLDEKDLSESNFDFIVHKIVSLISGFTSVVASTSGVISKVKEPIITNLYERFKPGFEKIYELNSYLRPFVKVIGDIIYENFDYIGEYLHPYALEHIQNIEPSITSLKNLGFDTEDFIMLFKLLRFPPEFINTHWNVSEVRRKDIEIEKEGMETFKKKRSLDNHNLRPMKKESYYRKSYYPYGITYDDSVNRKGLAFSDKKSYYLSDGISYSEDDIYYKTPSRKQNFYDYDLLKYSMKSDRKHDSHKAPHKGYGYKMKDIKDPFKILAGLAFVAFAAPLIYNALSLVLASTVAAAPTAFSSRKRRNLSEDWLVSVDYPNYFGSKENQGFNFDYDEKSDTLPIRDLFVDPINNLWDLLKHENETFCSEVFLKNRLKNMKSDVLSMENSASQLILSMVGMLKGKYDLGRSQDLWLKELLDAENVSSNFETSSSDCQIL